YRPKRLGLGGRRVSHADELQEGVAGGDALREGLLFERVAEHDLAPGRNSRRRTPPRERADGVASREQPRDDRPADISGGAGHEDQVRAAHLFEVTPLTKLNRLEATGPSLAISSDAILWRRTHGCIARSQEPEALQGHRLAARQVRT